MRYVGKHKELNLWDVVLIRGINCQAVEGSCLSRRCCQVCGVTYRPAFSLLPADSSSPGSDHRSAWNRRAPSEGRMRPGNQGLPRKHPPAHCLPAGLPQERQRPHAVLPATPPPPCPAGHQLQRYGHAAVHRCRCAVPGVQLLSPRAQRSLERWRRIVMPIWELGSPKHTAVSDFKMSLSCKPPRCCLLALMALNFAFLVSTFAVLLFF